MSIIHDALKKAQQERKQETTGVPFSPPETRKRPRIAVIGIVAVVAALVVAYLYIPAFHKQKTIVTAQTKTAAPSPAAKVPAPVKSSPAEQKEAGPQRVQTLAPEGGRGTGTGLTRADPAPEASPAKKKDINRRENAGPTIASRSPTPAAKPVRTAGAEGTGVRLSGRTGAGGGRSAVQESAEEGPIRRTVVRRSEDEKIKARYNEALNLMNTGRSREAQKIFLEIIARRPEDVESLNNLGVICASQGNRKEALGYFKRILDVRTDYPKAYNNIGLIMMSENDVQLAEEYFRKAISLDPDGLEPYMNLSALLRSQGRFQDAAKLLEKPVKKNGRDPLLCLSYAVIKDNLGETGEAAKYYRQYLSLSRSSDPQRAGVLERLRYLEGGRK